MSKVFIEGLVRKFLTRLDLDYEKEIVKKFYDDKTGISVIEYIYLIKYLEKELNISFQAKDAISELSSISLIVERATLLSE